MQERIEEELELIRQRFPDVEYQEEGYWVCVSSYSLPEGWNRETTEVAFQISQGHPGTPPYGMYVPSGLRFQGEKPNNYDEPAGNEPPFVGSWGFFSWTPADGNWIPSADVRSGVNLLDWVKGFMDRFEEGR